MFCLASCTCQIPSHTRLIVSGLIFFPCFISYINITIILFFDTLFYELGVGLGVILILILGVVLGVLLGVFETLGVGDTEGGIFSHP